MKSPIAPRMLPRVLLVLGSGLGIQDAAAATLEQHLSAGASSGDHPVGKVIGLLQGLMTTTEEEGKAEELSYTKFSRWCTNSLKTLSKAMEEGKQSLLVLDGEIEAGEREEKGLEGDIASLKEELQAHDVKATEADTNRQNAHDLYVKATGDMRSTITACSSAIDAVSGSKPAEFLDVRTPTVRQALSFLELAAGDRAAEQEGLFQVLQAASDQEPRPELKAAGDRAAHVQRYKFKSGSVLEMLKSLKLSFEDDLVEAEKAETNAVNAHQLEKTARDQAISAAQTSKTEKESFLGKLRSNLIQHKREHSDKTADLAADSQNHDDTKNSCEIKAHEWEERSSVRAGEIQAMKAAIGILEKAAGVRSEAPSNPVPPPAPVDAPDAPVFLQVEGGRGPSERAAELLRVAAHTTHSKVLARLAQEMTLHKNDPFGKVNNMIEKMIFRLMDEQRKEDEHKNWCDLELEKTNTSKADKEDKLGELDLALEGAQAKLQKLTEDIAEAEAMVADLTGFMNEATEIRQIGKRENAAALKDAQDAQTAIAEATAVLEAFYKESGAVPKESWEFLQSGRAPAELPENPATWDSGYTGVSDPARQPGGIIAVLKETSAEFAKMEADTRAQEETDQRNYDEDMKSSQIEQARRQKEGEMKASEKRSLSEKIGMLTKNRKHVAGEHELVVQYLKDLQPACVEGDSSYEDRKDARSQEMDALRKSQDILADAFKNKGDAPPPPSEFLAIRRH